MTWARHRAINDHIDAAQGGELANAAADILELGDPYHDPQIFTGPNGRPAKELVEDAIAHMNDWDPREIKNKLYEALRLLAAKKLEAVPEGPVGRQGGKKRRTRGRKSRRKTLRKRK